MKDFFKKNLIIVIISLIAAIAISLCITKSLSYAKIEKNLDLKNKMLDVCSRTSRATELEAALVECEMRENIIK